ncbi:signal peptide peptidase SppA [Pseudahrensia aquimaris]|uniref:Signal peptide peptidase SppA n=1 Tax=Pseudahrensia aquimaris TaxID=744461 RepID=A0ABW3FJZ8_9HYPH
MTTDIDHILDRRSLRKKVSFWRIAALLAFAAVVLALLSSLGVFKGAATAVDHIARVEIEGTITENRKLLQLIKEVEDNDNVKGVVLVIDSPGGTTVGGEAIYEAVRNLTEKKPTVTSVGTLAASAGYMIASATDHIVARNSSIVGSIGVIIQYPQASELLAKIGIEMKEVKSSPLKAEPSPFNESPPEATAMLQTLIDDGYRWFVDLVTERRKLPREEVLRLADGSVYSGTRALDLKLIDALGGEDVARKWLVDEKGLSDDLKVLDWKVKSNVSAIPFTARAVRWMMGDTSSGLDGIDPDTLPAIVPKRLFLDGLLSVWHG